MINTLSMMESILNNPSTIDQWSCFSEKGQRLKSFQFWHCQMSIFLSHLTVQEVFFLQLKTYCTAKIQ